MKTIFIFLVTLCFDTILSSEHNQTKIDVKHFCEKLCSDPKWELSFQEATSTCICWVDKTIDDVDANNMQLQATKQGFTLWVVRNDPQRNRRDLNTTTIEISSTSEKSLESDSDVKPTTSLGKIQEVNSRFSESEDTKILKPIALKKHKLKSDDPIVGDAPKRIIEKLTPSIRPRQSPSRSCNPETLKLSLQNVKLHINRLLERVDQHNLNCALLVPELETVKNSVLQLITRVSEKKEHERPRLIEQFREREKERQTRIHSRLGHLDLPKRPSKLNLVGSTHNFEKNKDGKIIVTQPKGLID